MAHIMPPEYPEMENDMTNKKEDNNMEKSLAASGFMGMIPSDESEAFGEEGMVLYTTDKSNHFNPLILRKDGDNILVTPQAAVPEDTLVSLFSGEELDLQEEYSFPEKELNALLGDESQHLCDIVAFLEQNHELKSEKFMELLAALTAEGFSLCHVLLVLENMSKLQLTNLFLVFEEMTVPLREYFIQQMTELTNTDEEDET